MRFECPACGHIKICEHADYDEVLDDFPEYKYTCFGPVALESLVEEQFVQYSKRYTGPNYHPAIEMKVIDRRTEASEDDDDFEDQERYLHEDYQDEQDYY